MRVSIKIAVLFATLIVCFACTKDEITPNPPSNDPVFSATGSLDGNEINLEAGNANTFMYTDIANVNGVDNYRGSLINNNIEFKINISDGMLDIPDLNTDIIGSSIPIAPYSAGTVLAVLSKNMFSNSQYIEDLTWTINGEEQSYEEISIEQPGEYDICADIEFVDGTTGSTCNTYLIGYQKNVNAVVKYLVGQNNQIISLVEAPNNEVSTIEWFRNDVLISQNTTYRDSTSGLNSYSLKAKIHFVNGSLREREIWVNRLNNNNKIEDLSNIENQSNLSWDHKASITIEHNGESYISSPGNQDQQIIVTHSFDFGNNDNGQNVTFIEGSLNATFIKQSNMDTVSGSFNIQFGIAH
jgi:hypothetical protein